MTAFPKTCCTESLHQGRNPRPTADSATKIFARGTWCALHQSWKGFAECRESWRAALQCGTKQTEQERTECQKKKRAASQVYPHSTCSDSSHLPPGWQKLPLPHQPTQPHGEVQQPKMTNTGEAIVPWDGRRPTTTKAQDENTIHMFWRCSHTKQLWKHFTDFCNRNIRDTTLTLNDVLYGVKDRTICKLIFTAKTCFYNRKIPEDKIRFDSFITHL